MAEAEKIAKVKRSNLYNEDGAFPPSCSYFETR